MSARSFTLNKRRQGNITVERYDNFIEVYLHGNLVVKHDTLGDELYVSNCGWGTPTTRTAINRYFSNAGIQAGVYQSKHEQFLQYGQEIVSLCKNGDSFTFYPNSKEYAATKLSKKVYAGKIIKEENNTITVRG
jgi:hypothetical protein